MSSEKEPNWVDAIVPVPASTEETQGTPPAAPDLLDQTAGAVKLFAEDKPTTLLTQSQMPVLIAVRGDGIREPRVTVDSDADCTFITISCATNRDVWVEEQIPTETLLELLERAFALHPKYPHTLLDMVKGVRHLYKG